MKKALVLVAVLSLVGAASAAQIQLFWSSTGISDAGLQYSTALTNFQPAFVAPTPVGATLVEGSYDLFLWGRFDADWTDYQIYGIDLKKEGAVTWGSNVAYRQKWGNPAGSRRWDGSAGIQIDGVGAAVMASGIYDTMPNSNMVLATGEFLYGAAHVTGAAGQSATISLDTAALGLGINTRDSNGNEVVPDPTILPATVGFVVPEPTSILLALAGLLIRRR